MARDDMSIDERYQYLRRMQTQYLQANRPQRQALLDQMVAYTGLHRKSVLRRLHSTVQRRPRRRERAKRYGAEVDTALAIIWESLDHPCALRLQPNLVRTGKHLARYGELTWSPTLEAQLARISVSSVARHLPSRPPEARARKAAAPLNRHQQALPAYRIPRDIPEPGHLELDLVHHSGPVTEGEYVYTLQLIDVATGWGARRAILGRSYIVVADALAHLFAQLPFPVRELHPDNGSEFLNAHLLAFLEREFAATHCSRSRPGCPNDNRLVEEKNASIVRRWIGDRRLDSVQQTRWLNTFYDQLYVYHNYFIPVLKQTAKAWQAPTTAHQGYVKRTHDPARTPLDRLCDLQDGAAGIECQALLKARAALNPRQLRRDILQALEHLSTYAGAVPGRVENVYQTLADPERFPEAGESVDKPPTGLPTDPPAPTTTETLVTPTIGKEAA